MEGIIRDQLVQHMDAIDLFNKRQYGFRNGRYCPTQLLERLQCWTDIIESGVQTYVIYFDFSKAFDKVSHTRLIFKFKKSMEWDVQSWDG